MRKCVLIAVALTASCTTMERSDSARWLVGTWLMMDEGVEHPLGCASGLPIQYLPDGAYRLMEERGSWRLRGDRLTETARSVTGAGAPAEEGHIGRPFVSRIERIDQDGFRKTYAWGHIATFRRCPRAQ